MMDNHRERLEGKYVRILGKIIKLKPLIISAKHSSQLEVGDYSILNCEKDQITVCDRNKNGYGVTIKVSEVREAQNELGLPGDLVKADGFDYILTITSVALNEEEDEYGYILDDDCTYSYEEILAIYTPKEKDYIFQWEVAK